MVLKGVPTSIFLTCFPSTISKKNILESRPAVQSRRLLTGEKAIPLQMLLWAVNLCLSGFGGGCVLPIAMFSFPSFCDTIDCKSQIQIKPDSYAVASTCRFMKLNRAIVRGALMDLSLKILFAIWVSLSSPGVSALTISSPSDEADARSVS